MSIKREQIIKLKVLIDAFHKETDPEQRKIRSQAVLAYLDGVLDGIKTD